jgi:hypothetical protein
MTITITSFLSLLLDVVVIISSQGVSVFRFSGFAYLIGLFFV